MKLKNLAIGTSSLAFGALAFGCTGLGGAGFDCSTQQSAYQDSQEGEGVLQESIATEGPYAMALVISQDGINKLLATVLDQDLPPIEDEVTTGLSYTAQPSLPTISIESFPDCPTCLRANIGFDLGVNLFGARLNDGRAAVTLRLPIEMAPQGNTATSLMAHMEQATVEDIDLNIAGLNSNDFRQIEDALEQEATRYVRRQFGLTEVVKLNSWAIGDGDVLLAARGPHINTEQRTILLGLNSNLSLPANTSLEAQTTLPDGVPMLLQFHPELLLSMGQRMMTEGHIARDYDSSGDVMEEGDHHVSLMAMSTTDSGLLNTGFRIWRTGGGLCGYADVTAGMSLTVTDANVQIKTEDLRIDDGEGSGALIAQNQWLAGDFMQSLTEQLELTVNYREIDASSEDKMAAPEATLAQIDGRGLTVFLDIAVLEAK